MKLTRSMLVLGMLVAIGCGGDTGPTPLTKAEAHALWADGKADQVDLCADTGWYGDGECDVFCGQPDPDCATACAAAGGECVAVYPGTCADGVIGAASLFGILVGAIGLGGLSDHFGRKRMFIVDMTMIGIAGLIGRLRLTPGSSWSRSSCLA